MGPRPGWTAYRVNCKVTAYNDFAVQNWCSGCRFSYA